MIRIKYNLTGMLNKLQLSTKNAKTKLIRRLWRPVGVANRWKENVKKSAFLNGRQCPSSVPIVDNVLSMTTPPIPLVQFKPNFTGMFPRGSSTQKLNETLAVRERGLSL